jgi:hypothetical protein
LPGTAHTWVDGDVATAAFLNALPRGVMGNALGAGSSQTGITGLVDITGLSITYTAIASRLYKTTVVIPVNQVTSAAMNIFIPVTDAAGTAVRAATISLGASEYAVVSFTFVETGLSGTITRKVRASTSAGTLTVYGDAAQRGQFIIEDIGV